MPQSYKYLFGPVPSRRLGRSLGVDLVPYKTCSFDCIFCQLGRTTNKTVTRKEYVPVSDVLAELENRLSANTSIDYITLSGSGEPTLHSEFGQVIEFVRNNTRIPAALLTNSSLLTDPDVRAQASTADIIKASFSAWDQTSLKEINRPHPDVKFEQILEGLQLLRQQFSGEIRLEVFLVWGTNTTQRAVQNIAEQVKNIAPDRIQLNTTSRPPCEQYAYALPQDQMLQLAELFDPTAEVIAEYTSESNAGGQTNQREILHMLQRRPCTIDDICRVFGIHRNEALKYVGKLLRTGDVKKNEKKGTSYYSTEHENEQKQ